LDILGAHPIATRRGAAGDFAADPNEAGEIDDRREPLQLRKIVALCGYFR